ncbi:MAG: hypothetical protein RIB15_12780 [Gracilimonas sp.]
MNCPDRQQQRGLPRMPLHRGQPKRPTDSARHRLWHESAPALRVRVYDPHWLLHRKPVCAASIAVAGLRIQVNVPPILSPACLGCWLNRPATAESNRSSEPLSRNVVPAHAPVLLYLRLVLPQHRVRMDFA